MAPLDYPATPSMANRGFRNCQGDEGKTCVQAAEMGSGTSCATDARIPVLGWVEVHGITAGTKRLWAFHQEDRQTPKPAATE